MQRYRLYSLIGLFVTPLASLLGVAACGDMEAVGIGGGDFTEGTGASTGTGSPTGGAGAGEPGEPPPPPSDGIDAGPDAPPPACDTLDMSKPVVLYLSADDSNSMASPARVRELIKLGAPPLANDVRTYEFLNYYHIQYDAPAPDNLAIFPELDAAADPGTFDFQIGVRSFDPIKPRRPMTITFVLDTSGSMDGPGIAREKAAIRAIAASLSQGDIVNVVTWNTENNTVLAGHSATGPNDPSLLQLADNISASGGTDLHSGLVAGYALAEQHYGITRMNRVILISDGGANVGITDADFIGQKSLDADKEGIYLVGIGTGPGVSYADTLMDTVTDKGRGAYIYLDTPEEASHMFEDRFDESMEIAARGVQVELTMPWYFQMAKFYGEEYSPNAQEIEPQHLAPGDAMVFNQIIRSCDPALINTSDTVTIRVRWKTPLTYTERETEVTATLGDLLAAQKSALPKAKAIIAYAEALKKPSKEALNAARDQALALNPSGTDADLNEIVSLIEMHPQF